MLIVISGFTCIYKWIFLIIIFNLSSFLKTSKVTEAVVWRFSNFIKNKTLARMFSCEFCQISKNTFGGGFCSKLLQLRLFNLKKKPQKNRVYNSELRNFNFNLFFYSESLKNCCIFERKFIQSKFLFSFLFCVLVIF